MYLLDLYFYICIYDNKIKRKIEEEYDILNYNLK